MKFGIIGAGNHAQKKVMPAIVKSGHEVSAIYSRNVDKAKKIGLKYLSKPYDDLETFFAGDFESVYIASPNFLHYEHALSALKRGKHVLLEKQMTLKTAEAEDLVKEAEKRNLALKVGFHLRFHPALSIIKKMISEGRIGDPVFVTGMWAGFSSGGHTDPDRKWWDEEEKSGGGSVMGTGVHVLDTLNHVLGKYPTGVTASRFPRKGIIDSTECIQLRFGTTVAIALSSRKMKEPDNSLYVYGTDGSLAARKMFGVDVDSVLELNGKKLESFKGTDMYEGEIKAFYKATRGEVTDIADGKDGLQVVRTVNAAFEGDYSGKWVED